MHPFFDLLFLLGVCLCLLVDPRCICHCIIHCAASPRTVDVRRSTRSHCIPISTYFLLFISATLLYHPHLLLVFEWTCSVMGFWVCFLLGLLSYILFEGHKWALFAGGVLCSQVGWQLLLDTMDLAGWFCLKGLPSRWRIVVGWFSETTSTPGCADADYLRIICCFILRGCSLSAPFFLWHHFVLFILIVAVWL